MSATVFLVDIMGNVSKNSFVKSAIWKMTESLSTRGVSVVISILLARILAPENYGVIALTDVFITFTNLLVQGGINTSLIRKESVDDLDYSNAFFIACLVAVVCYAAFFVAAPYIADYYNEPLVEKVLRVQMLSLFLCALGTVRGAIIVREFKFKQLCVVNLTANTLSGIIGIYLASKGAGVWALVAYTLSRDALSCLLLFFFVRWKMVFKLSGERIRSLFGFSIWVLLSTMLDFCANNIYSLVFGKHYSMEDLGYYNKGNQLPQLISLHTFGAISSVLLPTLANVQNDLPALKSIVRRITRMSAYIILPMMFGLAAVSDRLIPFLFTEKWIPCIPVMYAACISFAVNPFRSIGVQLLYAKGNSKQVVIIEAVRAALLIGGLFWGIGRNVSLYTMAYYSSIVAVITVLITQFIAGRHADYSLPEWIKDLGPSFLISAVMCALTFVAGHVPIQSNAVVLCIQVLIGMCVYLAASVLFKVPELKEMLEIVKGLIKR